LASEVAEAPVGTWTALYVTAYRRLWTASLFMFFAVMGQAVARGWLARELTGSNTGLGGIMLAFGLAMLVATPFGGVAADRNSKRAVIVISFATICATSLWVGLAVELDVIQYWMLLVASAFQAVAFALFIPARMAFISELVEARLLPNAIVLSQMSAEAMRVVGPATAGLLIGITWFGVGGVFLLASGLGAISLLLVLRRPPGSPRPGRVRRSPLADLTDAIRYLRRTHGLVLLAGTSLGVVMLGFPYLTFMPTIADDLFDVGSGGYGLMAAVAGLGAVLTGLVVARRTDQRSAWRILGVAGLAFGGALVVLGLAPTFGIALLGLLVIGGAGLAFQTTNQALLLALSDFEYHGRLQGLVALGFSGFGIAALPLGVLADTITLRLTLVLMGAAVCLVTLVFLLRRRRLRVLQRMAALA
jgi:MFS family permease